MSSWLEQQASTNIYEKTMLESSTSTLQTRTLIFDTYLTILIFYKMILISNFVASYIYRYTIDYSFIFKKLLTMILECFHDPLIKFGLH